MILIPENLRARLIANGAAETRNPSRSARQTLRPVRPGVRENGSPDTFGRTNGWRCSTVPTPTPAPRAAEGQTIPPRPRCLRSIAGQIVADLCGEEIFRRRGTRRLPGARQPISMPHRPMSLFWTPITTSIPGPTRRRRRRRAVSQERRSKNGAHLNTSVRSPHHTFTWFKSWQHLPKDHSVKEQRTTQTRMSRVPYRQAEI